MVNLKSNTPVCGTPARSSRPWYGNTGVPAVATEATTSSALAKLIAASVFDEQVDTRAHEGNLSVERVAAVGPRIEHAEVRLIRVGVRGRARLAAHPVPGQRRSQPA